MPAPRKRKASAKRAPQKSSPPRRKAFVRRRRIGSIIHVIEALICFAVLGGICYAFTQYVSDSERFKINFLQIEGTDILDAETVRAIAGITDNDNIQFFEAEAARQRVEAMPYVKHCEIQRAYPDTVIIKLTERVPIATLLLNYHAYEIDEDGVVLRELDLLAPHTGPLITEITGLGFVELGQHLDHPALWAALGIWDAFKNAPIAGEWTLSEIAASDENTLLMYCDDLPFEIRWANDEFQRQAQLLDIWWRVKKDDAPCSQYLDLRFGSDALVCK